MELNDIIEKFGFSPKGVGIRHRGYWIVDAIEDEEEYVGAKIGYLVVSARDGMDNIIDEDAFSKPNYVGNVEDESDMTYRYYYFSPLPATSGE